MLGFEDSDYCLIEVSEEHLPENTNVVQPIFFRKSCFGSKLLANSHVLDYTILPLLQDKNFVRKIKNKEDFLLISIFDIWLGNEDRAPHHTNLMMDYAVNSEVYFTVFDHDALFNQINDFGSKGLVLLDDECSLLSSEYADVLFKRNKKFVNNVNQIVENFYLCTERCEQELELILSCIPDSWGVNIENIQESLKATVFTSSWKEQCENHFRYLTQMYIK